MDTMILQYYKLLRVLFYLFPLDRIWIEVSYH